MGNVVLLGRVGQYILYDFNNAYQVLLVADLKSIIKFMQQFGMYFLLTVIATLGYCACGKIISSPRLSSA